MQHRSRVFHTAVASTVLGSLAAAYIFQDHVKAWCMPVFNSLEHSRFAYYLCTVAITAIPEPSPFVGLVAIWLVNYPPQAAWRWFTSSGYFEDYQIIVVMLTSIFVVVYWVNGLFLDALDRYLTKTMDHYRIQKKDKDKMRPPFSKCVRTILFNTCLVPFIGLAIGLNVKLRPQDRELPGPLEIFCCTIAGVLANEILFFYGHWLFHANKFLFRNIHTVHHEFKSPTALAAVYCHPIELVVSDFVPLSAGILLFNQNLYFAACFTTFAVMGTQTHHCGFRWPWIASHGNQPDFHDYHHERFNCNYGNMGFLDWMHGTNAGSRAHPIAGVTVGAPPVGAAAKAA